MSLDENKDLIRRYYNVWESGDMAALERLVDPGYVGHTALGDRDLDGLKDRISAFRAVMPGLVFSVETQLAEDDLVATRISVQARHAETGQPTHLMGLNISRIAGGKLAEEWSAWETMDVGDDPFDIEDSYLDK